MELTFSLAVLGVLLMALAIVLEPDVRGTVRRMDPNEKSKPEDTEVLREEDVTVHDRLEDGAVEESEILEELRDA